MPVVSIFTCSFNKPDYVADAIRSVLAQSFTDFEYWILENSTDKKTRQVIQGLLGRDPRIFYYELDFDEATRKDIYVESLLKNRFFGLATGKYVMYLADDDILLPDCFKVHLEDFEIHPSHKANYHIVQCEKTTTGESWPMFSGVVCEPETNWPGCNIDGGSLMFEASLLKKLNRPWFPVDWQIAATSDGEFMNRLVKLAKFYPINTVLSRKRMTPISVHQKG